MRAIPTARPARATATARAVRATATACPARATATARPARETATARAVRALTLLLLAAAAATALGCQESGFDERKETARPLKVQHVLGETKVPGQARRPLTLRVDALDDALALGVRPVRAAAPGGTLPAYLRRRAAGIELLPPLESATQLAALRSARPDVILASDPAQRRFYPALTKIAPTVATEGGSRQWKLNVRLVGEALGRTNDAEKLLIDYDAWVAKVRRSVHGKPRVAVVRRGPNGLEVAKRDSFAGTILADVGVRQVRSPRRANLVVRDDDGTWWGPGGILEAKAALADLERRLAAER